MCEAINYTNKIQEIFTEAENKFRDLLKELSNLDLQEQDVLHFIENERFSAYKGYVYSKKIQDIRARRRYIKNELDPMRNLISGYINKNKNELNKVTDNINRVSKKLLEVQENKTYIPRVLQSIS